MIFAQSSGNVHSLISLNLGIFNYSLVDKNKIGDAGAIALGEAITENESLKTFYLSKLFFNFSKK